MRVATFTWFDTGNDASLEEKASCSVRELRQKLFPLGSEEARSEVQPLVHLDSNDLCIDPFSIPTSNIWPHLLFMVIIPKFCLQRFIE